ncbi:T9SS type A sorting domain-containing protein [Hymenobacter sp. BT507]|uniref:T9SS type A sorting domain-containing protein n=1 Tax=Hymenobacter citatus TaxID=2763506 RepID=A0ABR7MF23_9BACT|nr:T9SS type A sorting domain-containing protein [Hymenobacter citatus]MBC6609664.1 T9SS type A sorting domain-containing protein [Hymenobacter citatus]
MCTALGLLGGSAHAQSTPTWASAQRVTSTGANSGSYGQSVAVSADGSQYVTGAFAGTITLGTTTLTAGAGTTHLFLAKYSAAGAVLWAIKLDASAYASSTVAVDAAGNAYMAGEFDSTITLGTTTLTTSAYDAYVVKYDAQGMQQWVRQGGTAGTTSRGIATDASGNVLLTGHFNTSVAFGGTPLTGGGIYFYRFSPAGNVLQATRVASQGFAYGLTADNTGNTYITGEFTDAVVFGTTTLTSAGRSDLYVCKLDATGTVLWARREGGPNEDVGLSVAVDANGNPVVGGYSDGVQVGGQQTSKLLLARYSNQGTALWNRQITPGEVGNYKVTAVAYDGRGGYYVTGSSRGSTVFGATTVTSASESAFVARYDSQGAAQWAGQVGAATAADQSSGFAIATDASGNTFVTGAAVGTLTFGTLPAVTFTSPSAFLLKLTAGGVIAASAQRTVAAPLAVYPNPASGRATIVVPATEGGTLELLDVQGRLLRHQALPAGADAHAVSLAGVAPGVYQLRTTSLRKGQVRQARLIIY